MDDERLTVTYGVRFEYFNGYVPATECGRHAERVGPRAQLRGGEERAPVEGRRSARGRGVRRLRQRTDGAEGGAWSIVSKAAIGLTQANNPINASINSVNRTWNDSFYPVAIRVVETTSRTATWRTAA